MFPESVREQKGKRSITQEDALVLRGCRNTSPELDALVQKAVDVQKHFGKYVKVELPRYRCLCCNQYFLLQNYRRVNNIFTHVYNVIGQSIQILVVMYAAKFC